MNGAAAVFRWLGHPFRAARALFPFTGEGRRTLINLALFFAGPALTIAIIWAMHTIRFWQGLSAELRLERFANLADRLSWGLLLVLLAFATYVSIRAIKVNLKDGTAEAEGGNNETNAKLQNVANAAQDQADQEKEP